MMLRNQIICVLDVTKMKEHHVDGIFLIQSVNLVLLREREITMSLQKESIYDLCFDFKYSILFETMKLV